MALRLWALLVILWPAGATYAQAKTTKIQPLTIGDTIPHDLVINNVYNYPDSQIRLSDLKGKLVILDFWATWCTACLKGFTKAEELQKQFKDKIKIIMINSDASENAAKVKAFLEKRHKRTGQKLTLPYAVQSVALNDYFPHKEVPHYVWLNNASKIVGITTSDEVSAENISALLKSSDKTIFTKKDHLRFNPEKPLLIDENGGDNPTGFIYRSIFTEFKENLGAGGGSRWGADKKTIRFYALNSNLLVLLQIAYGNLFKDYTPETTIVKSSHYSKEILLDRTFNRLPENRYCYEIILPAVSEEEIKNILKQDLIRTFGIEARKDITTLDCFVLKADTNKANFQTKGDAPVMDVESSSLKKHLTNKPIELLAGLLQSVLGVVVVNETGIEYNIDISFPYNFLQYKLPEVKDFLAKKGLVLLPAKRDLEVIVIADK